ncbi:MAG: PDZ domain-containing protein [Acidobacteriota bacterium]|nr:PDZ domain-containing protein [Acidobacteriota bacterium]
MIRKLSAFILLSIAVSGVAYGQQAPAPVERGVQRMVWAAPFDGSYLGVQTVEVTKENFSKYGLRDVRGVAIDKVVKDSPAAQAGLQTGDVIVRFNGEEITSVLKLTRLLREVAPDHQAKITVLRNGAESEFTVTLGKRRAPTFAEGGFSPENFSFPEVPNLPRVPMTPNGTFSLPIPPASGDNGFLFRVNASRQIGVDVTPLTKQLADFFGVAGSDGLLINNVRENSPAAKAGLKAGDIVTEADGKAIKSKMDLIRAISEKKEGDVTLTVIRDKNRQTIRVTPESAKGDAMPFQYFGDLNGENPEQQLFKMQKLLPPQPPNAPAPPIQQLFAPPIL